MKHDPIRPSIEQLFAQWRVGQALAYCHQALHDACDDIEKREALWSAFERNEDHKRRCVEQVLEQIDATFGPGMGEAVKEMLG